MLQVANIIQLQSEQVITDNDVPSGPFPSTKVAGLKKEPDNDVPSGVFPSTEVAGVKKEPKDVEDEVHIFWL